MTDADRMDEQGTPADDEPIEQYPADEWEAADAAYEAQYKAAYDAALCAALDD